MRLPAVSIDQCVVLLQRRYMFTSNVNRSSLNEKLPGGQLVAHLEYLNSFTDDPNRRVARRNLGLRYEPVRLQEFSGCRHQSHWQNASVFNQPFNFEGSVPGCNNKNNLNRASASCTARRDRAFQCLQLANFSC